MKPISSALAKLVRSDALVEGEPVPLRVLLFTAGHSPLQARQRARLILIRVRLIAALLAVLTVLWIGIDAVAFERSLWLRLAVLRLSLSAAFTVLAVTHRDSERLGDAWRSLALLLLIPTLLFLYAHYLLPAALTDTVMTAYGYLPFILMAGLSMFPLTALESAVFALPILLAQVAVGITHGLFTPTGSEASALSLLLLIMATATLAAMSQLQYMIALINQSVHDPLTGCYNRRSGEKLLEVQFHIAHRHNTPLALAFLDLDDFKVINDRYGHEVGDSVLRIAAHTLQRMLRAGDVLIRWGGEEFVIVLPNTDCAAALEAFSRLEIAGLATRPGGGWQTASIGIAELHADGVRDWRQLVSNADQRMYEAKAAGKNCCVGCREQVTAQRRSG